MREPRNLEQVCALGPDWIGFIFYPDSKRFVGRQPDPALFSIPGNRIRKVGVFVNEDQRVVRTAAEKYRLDMVQLHGGESLTYCRQLQEEGIEVIKTLHAGTPLGEFGSDAVRGAVRYFLFDTPGKEFGGTGRKFNWQLLNRQEASAPFLVGGGIGPADTGNLEVIRHPMWTGVDVNSRFEQLPGRKDTGLLEKFILEIRKMESDGISSGS